MAFKTLVLTVFLFLFATSSFSAADELDSFKEDLTMIVGETNGTWIIITNTGGFRDTMRIEGEINDSSTTGEYGDWVKFAFECVEGMGICDDMMSSKRKYVDQIELTPKMNQTRFYLEVTGYKITDPSIPVEIVLSGYSLTNYTKRTGDLRIEVNVKGPSGTYENQELPGINPVFLPLIVFFGSLFFYKKIA